MHHDHDGGLILIRLGHHTDKLALYLGHVLENPVFCQHTQFLVKSSPI